MTDIGRRFVQASDDRYRGGPDRPFTREELRAKFTDCAQHVAFAALDAADDISMAARLRPAVPAGGTDETCWVQVPREMGRSWGPARFTLLPILERQSDTIDTEVALLIIDEERIFAVKGAHQPLEVWRRVLGFVPDECEV